MAPESSDAELLASGVPDAFGEFYLRHVDDVRGYVARRTRSEDLVLDLVAETFARALGHRHRYDEARGPAIAWLFGIAYHLIVDASRRRTVSDRARRRLGMERIVLDDDDLLAISDGPELDVDALLCGLPPAQRELLIRRFLRDEGYADIASDVGCSEQVVRQRVSRSLAALRRSSEDAR